MHSMHVYMNSGSKAAWRRIAHHIGLYYCGISAMRFVICCDVLIFESSPIFQLP